VAVDQPAVAEVSFNGQARKIDLKPGEWLVLEAGEVKAAKGTNQIKLRVISGTAEFDWIEIR
jgi:hypothetical protein